MFIVIIIVLEELFFISQYKAGTKTPGFETKIGEMAQFFNRTGTTVEPAEAQ